MVYPPNPPSGADSSSRPDDERHTLRIIAVGSLSVVNYYVMQMFQLDYAEPREWSKPLPTVNPNEVMRILTKRIRGLNP
ncbi:MAG TPA: hypothetical protein ACFE0H_16420 [Elainellaceae cyanobacterium]|jgi:hypothetical protein